MNKLFKEREDINKLYNAPEYRRWRYVAFAVISIAVILLLSMIIRIDDLSPKIMLFMRGCVGLCALIFVIIVGIITYKVNTRYINNRNHH